ncbi:MAG: DUF3943 domain-containing protein [Verrucomicrobiae bacterium]|nr:DUF3943 domain-containing protein [Verrucomicrobiae bacterium]MCP5541005.1 DUF3943 domain-containing protein [Akkermansiaceae bacterium]MCP5550819.1 DUF3943 domain-containing protein [Akkermansiaceae bacterium]
MNPFARSPFAAVPFLALTLASALPVFAGENDPPAPLDDAKLARATLFAPSANGDRDLTYPITYVLSKQAIGLGVLVAMDQETTHFGTFSGETFKDGFRSGPKWDDDEWYWNYIAHPLWGSETYLRARSQNFTFFESFLFSTASSVVWEYGMENWASHPSQQDLMFTSTIGSLIGEVRFQILKDLAGKDDPKSKALRFAVDPLQGTTKFIGEKIFHADWEEPAFRITPLVDASGSLGMSGSVSFKF